METIGDIYMAFGKNFLCASMMYLPGTILEVVDEPEKKLFKDYVDTIFIIECNGDNYFLDEDQKLCTLHILPKKMLLDENIFLLLRYREEHSKASFDYIFKKYMEQLEGYRYFTQWLFENASTYIKDMTTDSKNGFELQYKTFMTHETELKAQFPIESRKIKLPEIKTLNVKSADQLVGMIGDTELKKIVRTIPEKLGSKTRKKDHIKKLKAELKSNADKLILENIFHIGQPTE
jgi:hypothetical protein